MTDNDPTSKDSKKYVCCIGLVILLSIFGLATMGDEIMPGVILMVMLATGWIVISATSTSTPQKDTTHAQKAASNVGTETKGHASFANKKKKSQKSRSPDNKMEAKRKAKRIYKEGVRFSKQGKYKQALECYDKAISHFPLSKAWNSKGIALAKQDKYKKAIKCYNRALDINIKNVAALNNKGIALIKTKKYERAMECFRRALQISPHSRIAKRNLQLIKKVIGKTE